MKPPQFGLDITNQANNNNFQHMTAEMICTRIAGRGVIRVIGRCDDAKENKNLDLSECHLMQIPDAVFHLMRHTELTTCDLSSNVISKIPPKLVVKFSLITELNLSHNRLSKLPDEICELSRLLRLDISHNAFVTLSKSLFKVPNLTHLNAAKNYVTDVDIESVKSSPCLEEFDLRENPLNSTTSKALATVASHKLTIRTSEVEPEEWEDLEDSD